MREQDMRARVEGYLRRRLCRLVVPPAFGVGVALTGACRAHIPPGEDPALTSQTADAEPDDLDRPEGIPIYSAAFKPNTGLPAYRQVKSRASDIALAVEKCDRLFLRTAILSHAEFASLRAGPQPLPPKKKGPESKIRTPLVLAFGECYFLPLCPPPLWRESPPPPVTHLSVGEMVTCSLGSLVRASL